MVDFAKGFDVRKAATEGAWLQLKHPGTGEELGVENGGPARIKLMGADSMSYEEAVARTIAMSKTKRTPADRITSIELLDAARKNDQSQVEQLAAITMGWENIEWDGEEFPHNEDNAKRLYGEHKWIREQAFEFFLDRANFLGNA